MIKFYYLYTAEIDKIDDFPRWNMIEYDNWFCFCEVTRLFLEAVKSINSIKFYVFSDGIFKLSISKNDEVVSLIYRTKLKVNLILGFFYRSSKGENQSVYLVPISITANILYALVETGNLKKKKEIHTCIFIFF